MNWLLLITHADAKFGTHMQTKYSDETYIIPLYNEKQVMRFKDNWARKEEKHRFKQILMNSATKKLDGRHTRTDKVVKNPIERRRYISHYGSRAW